MAEAICSELLPQGLERATADGTPATDARPSGRPIDVLVVDNDHASRTSFGLILQAAGFVADEADDGFAALERLRSVTVGSVLLELDLPGLGGLQLLDKLDNPPPVILMTAGEYSTDVMLRRSKAYMFIQKPIPPAHLVAAVTRTLALGHQRPGNLFAATARAQALGQ